MQIKGVNFFPVFGWRPVHGVPRVCRLKSDGIGSGIQAASMRKSIIENGWLHVNALMLIPPAPQDPILS